MEGDGEFEARVCSAPTIQEKSSNGIAEVSLPSTSSTLKEKCYALIAFNRGHNSIKSQPLLHIEGCVVLFHIQSEIIDVIVKLILQKEVAKDLPMMLGKGNGREILESLAHLSQDAIYEVKPIIKDLIYSEFPLIFSWKSLRVLVV